MVVRWRSARPASGAFSAVLLAEANRAVSSDELFERVWAGRPPQHGRNALAGYLSRLRGVLTPAGGVEITYGHGGYLLRVDPLAVDLHAFGDLTARVISPRTAGSDWSCWMRPWVCGVASRSPP